MDEDDLGWSIPCLDFANRPRVLRLELTRPVGLALLVPAGEAAVLMPDQIGQLIDVARFARTALLRNG